MERAIGGRVAVRVRDALAEIAKSRLTHIDRFATLIEDCPAWHIALLADGGIETTDRFELRLGCVVTEKQDGTVRSSPLVLTVVRANDAQTYTHEFSLDMNPLNGEFRIEVDAVCARFEKALKHLRLGK